jgi:hypothetical protein
MKNNKRVSIAVGLILAIAAIVVIIAWRSYYYDPFAEQFAAMGYKLMNHPRDNFGTGTIVKNIGKPEEKFVASREQCFPQLEFITGGVVLANTMQASGMRMELGGRYLPASITGLLGYNDKINLDVKFGKSSSQVLTIEGLTQYLEEHEIKKSCLRYLIDSQNTILVSTVKVENMSYDFHGDQEINTKLNLERTKEQLKADGITNYKITQENNLIVESPMYIAYKAFKFEDLGIKIPEGSNDDILIKLNKGTFRLEEIK